MRWVARVALSVPVGTAVVLRADHTIASVPVVSSAGFLLLVPGTALDGLSFPARTVQCLSPRFWLQSLPPSSFSAGPAVLALATRRGAQMVRNQSKLEELICKQRERKVATCPNLVLCPQQTFEAYS